MYLFFTLILEKINILIYTIVYNFMFSKDFVYAHRWIYLNKNTAEAVIL